MPDQSPSLPDADAPGSRAEVPDRRTVWRVIVSSLVVLGLVTGLGVVYAYNHLDGNIRRVSVDDKIDKRLEHKGPEGQLNILVMGSDDRSCDGCAIDKEGGGGSDTTILLHLSADRSRAYGVSIPRDSLVTRPDCGADNEIPGGTDQMWNRAFLVGGEACTVEQVEATTGVPVDYYVIVDFAGFKEMVDAIGGVPVCIPEDIDDPESGIAIKAGTREISGDEALKYVRVRKNVGDQSDLGRIKRQQTFIGAMIKKVTSRGIVARPDKLFGFLDAMTSAVQSDFESVAQLAGLARQLQSIGLDHITFLTVPWKYDYRPKPYTYKVNWVEPEARRLWQLIVADKPLPAKYTDGSISVANAPAVNEGASPDPGAGSTPDATSPPSPAPEQPEDAEDAEGEADDAGLCA